MLLFNLPIRSSCFIRIYVWVKFDNVFYNTRNKFIDRIFLVFVFSCITVCVRTCLFVCSVTSRCLFSANFTLTNVIGRFENDISAIFLNKNCSWSVDLCCEIVENFRKIFVISALFISLAKLAALCIVGYLIEHIKIARICTLSIVSTD